MGMGVTDTDQTAFPQNAYIASITSATEFELSENETSGATTNITDCIIGNANGIGEGAKYDRGLYFHVIQTTGTFAVSGNAKSGGEILVVAGGGGGGG